jgi:superfamily II DNA or RNA helicase
MELREYQKQAIQNIRLQFAQGKNRIILCAPTGSGKTIIFSEIARLTFERNNSVLIITNRKELISQTNNKLNQFGLYPDLLTAKTKDIPEKTIVVAMVETLARRMKKTDFYGFIEKFHLIIIDEAHIQSFNKLFEYINDKHFVIGATATPYRDSNMKPLKLNYDSIINVCQVKYLIENNFLSNPDSFGVPMNLKGIKTKGNDFDEEQLSTFYDDDVKYTGAVQNYLKHAKDKKALVFCVSIINSKSLSIQFQNSGIPSKHFDCYMSDAERSEILNWFFNTKNAVLCNVGILTTGFDCPEVECILIYRATKSLPLFLQMVGRGSRIAENKNNFTILDFGNNIHRLGLWEADREWTLEVKEKSKKTKKVAPVKYCSECGAILPINIKICKYCGYEFPSKQEQKTEIDVILERLTPSQLQKTANINNMTIAELEEIRIKKGYKVGWLLYKLNTYEQFLEYEKYKGYKRGWAHYQFERRSNN